MSLKQIGIALANNNVKHLWIGGDAVMYYGVNRGSLDHDIWVPEEEKNTRRLVGALASLGYIDDPEKIVTHNKQTYTWPEFIGTKILTGFSDNDLKKLNVFCANEFSGLQFKESYSRSEKEFIGGQYEVCFISKQDLIHLKREAGREKDYRDLKLLTEENPD